MKARSVYILLSLLGLSLLTSFQNCSGVKFEPAVDPSQAVTDTPVDPPVDPPIDPPIDPPDEPVVVSETKQADTKTLIDKVDVLFVLDESVSMDKIIEQVNNGFKMITDSSYPADTLFAVTNMAPAKYTNAAANVFDASQGYVAKPLIPFQPGFLKLVTKNSINSFTTAYPAPAIAGRFPLSGCNDEWFRPNQKNQDNQPCLLAHTKIAGQAIGVEAGITALDQLMRHLHSQGGKRLFRQNALANVIFVSDTHDAGNGGTKDAVVAPYYGAAGARAAIPTLAEIQSLAASTNPGLFGGGIKFHGVVPLPPVGDSRLQGLKTIGPIPATLADSEIGNGELLHDFSYLPLIKGTGGAAMHPKSSNWTQALGEMVQEASQSSTPVVVLSQPAIKIVEVLVQGVKIPSSSYYLGPDMKTITINANSAWPAKVSVKVSYEIEN